MRYNIDTKENFDIITPINDTFNQELAVEINQFIQNSIEKQRSVIIDFTSINSIEETNTQHIIDWHHEMYNADLSFVLCTLSESVKNILLNMEDAAILNITPKQIEAIDIVAMEGLERELMGDDDFDF